MPDNFFTQLSGFTSFSDVTDDSHYTLPPEDWYVILTDIVSSTHAIAEGRYKDVNMVGAACIAAVSNIQGNLNLPYSFGGDGATILCPPSLVEAATEELLNIKTLAKETLSLELRVGVIPLHDIVEQGRHIRVAKYITPSNCSLAMFKGGGLSTADNMVKQGYNGKTYIAEQTHTTSSPNLNGLSCRWQPIKSSNGAMLTLLVLALDEEESTSLYRDINQFIVNTLKDTKNAGNPTTTDNTKYKWPPKSLNLEAKFVGNTTPLFIKKISITLFTAWYYIMHTFHLSLGAFNARAYHKDMLNNTDYQKFDDMLRMVIDCSDEHFDKITTYLKQLHSDGRIVFGTHSSAQALMTCFVQSLEGSGHVHFIDGDDGGYAAAAVSLKQQLQHHAAKG